jgi:hypothetical protein
LARRRCTTGRSPRVRVTAGDHADYALTPTRDRPVADIIRSYLASNYLGKDIEDLAEIYHSVKRSNPVTLSAKVGSRLDVTCIDGICGMGAVIEPAPTAGNPVASHMFAHVHSQILSGLDMTDQPVERGVPGTGVDQYADSLRQPEIEEGLMKPFRDSPGFGPLVDLEWFDEQPREGLQPLFEDMPKTPGGRPMTHTTEAAWAHHKLLQERVVYIMSGYFGNRLTFAPPLVITEAKIDKALEALDKVIGTLEQKYPIGKAQ